MATSTLRQQSKSIPTAKPRPPTPTFEADRQQQHILAAAKAKAIAFALRVRGNLMAPTIKDGWFVVIDPNGSVSSGEYVFVKMNDGRKMVKEFLRRTPDSITVSSVDGADEMTLDAADVECMQAVAAIVPPSKLKPEELLQVTY